MSVTLLDEAGIDAAIVTIRGSSKELQTIIHGCAVSVLAHISVHGDTRQAVRLLTALPSGQRREALAFWFNKFSGKTLSISNSKDSGWNAKLKGGRLESDFDIEGAMATDYGDLMSEPKIKALELKNLVAAITKFTSNSKKLEDGSPQVPATVVAAAQKALAALTA